MPNALTFRQFAVHRCDGGPPRGPSRDRAELRGCGGRLGGNVGACCRGVRNHGGSARLRRRPRTLFPSRYADGRDRELRLTANESCLEPLLDLSEAPRPANNSNGSIESMALPSNLAGAPSALARHLPGGALHRRQRGRRCSFPPGQSENQQPHPDDHHRSGHRSDRSSAIWSRASKWPRVNMSCSPMRRFDRSSWRAPGPSTSSASCHART